MDTKITNAQRLEALRELKRREKEKEYSSDFETFALLFLVVGALCSSVVVLLLSLTCSGLAWVGVWSLVRR